MIKSVQLGKSNEMSKCGFLDCPFENCIKFSIRPQMDFKVDLPPPLKGPCWLLPKKWIKYWNKRFSCRSSWKSNQIIRSDPDLAPISFYSFKCRIYSIHKIERSVGVWFSGAVIAEFWHSIGRSGIGPRMWRFVSQMLLCRMLRENGVKHFFRCCLTRSIYWAKKCAFFSN